MYADASIVLGSGREISKTALFRGLHYGGWLALGAIVFAWELSFWSPLLAGLDELMWNVSGVVLTLGFRDLFRRARSAAWSYGSLGLLALAMCVLAAPVWYLAYAALLRTAVAGLSQLTGQSALISHDVVVVALQTWAMPVRTWITCSCLLLAWSTLYFGINSVLDLELERGRVATALKMAERARLKVLQTQLNPQFLFSSLSGIAARIRGSDRAAAAAMVDALSDFLRSILQKLERPEIVVAEELELIRQYLGIERERIGRLQTSVRADPDTLAARIPTLILQPIVEKALHDGVSALPEGGTVRIQVRRQGGMLVITIEDDGPGPASRCARGLDFSNSAERLATLYGARAKLTVASAGAGQGLSVVIRLPYREEISA
jgi:signal transduction histidine kinase